MRNPDRRILQVQVPLALYQRLKKQAVKSGETVSVYVRRLLGDAL